MSNIAQYKPNFYPPRLNPFLVRLAQLIAPCVVRWLFRFELVVSCECLEKIRSLKNQRLLLLPNHPTFQDPIVMFMLSAKLGQTFYYLAAHELFNSSLSSIFQRLGIYSIRRGLVDRKSIAQTLELLTQPGCHLVVFPEGGCSFQNDTVMPFRVGAVQIAFHSMSKISNQGEPLPDIYVLPVSIKYRYTQDMNEVINQTLHRLEQAFNLKVVSGSSPYQRLRALAEQVLVKVEQDYELHTSETNQQPWEQRISLLRTYILENCEQQLGIASNPDELARERTYRIQYALVSIPNRDLYTSAAPALDILTHSRRSDVFDSNEKSYNKLESEEAMPKSDMPQGVRTSSFKLIEKSVKRLLNFDAIYDGYVAENPTPERFLDTLTRLEREVFDIDKPPPKGYRQVRIKIGEPVNLKDVFADYQRARTYTVNAVMLKIKQTVQKNLDLLAKNR